MNLSTIIVIVLIALAVAGACFLQFHRKSTSSCGGGCGDCPLKDKCPKDIRQ